MAGLELTRNWVEKNRDLIAWIEPGAGALCCIKLNEEHFTDENIKAFYSLSKAAGIQIASGTWFGETERYFRLGFGYMDLVQLELTLSKLSEVLKAAAL